MNEEIGVTDDELLIFQKLGLCQIRDSNRAMLLAACKEQDCEVIDMGITPDIEVEVSNMLDKAISSNVDIFISSGGVSMGDKDFVKPLLEQRGKVYFSKV